ncbi:MAG: hypothetical protein WBE90_21465 [Xanthobacteraceae bacterium]
MPRYFFPVQQLGRLIRDDPCGLILPNATAALSHAEHVIDELQNRNDPRRAELAMIVQNETHETLLSLPFLAGCA